MLNLDVFLSCGLRPEFLRGQVLAHVNSRRWGFCSFDGTRLFGLPQWYGKVVPCALFALSVNRSQVVLFSNDLSWLRRSWQILLVDLHGPHLFWLWVALQISDWPLYGRCLYSLLLPDLLGPGGFHDSVLLGSGFRLLDLLDLLDLLVLWNDSVSNLGSWLLLEFGCRDHFESLLFWLFIIKLLSLLGLLNWHIAESLNWSLLLRSQTVLLLDLLDLLQRLCLLLLLNVGGFD